MGLGGLLVVIEMGSRETKSHGPLTSLVAWSTLFRAVSLFSHGRLFSFVSYVSKRRFARGSPRVLDVVLSLTSPSGVTGEESRGHGDKDMAQQQAALNTAFYAIRLWHVYLGREARQTGMASSSETLVTGCFLEGPRPSLVSCKYRPATVTQSLLELKD